MGTKTSFSNSHHPSSDSDADDVDDVEIKLEPLTEDEILTGNDTSSNDDGFLPSKLTLSSQNINGKGARKTGKPSELSCQPQLSPEKDLQEQKQQHHPRSRPNKEKIQIDLKAKANAYQRTEDGSNDDESNQNMNIDVKPELSDCDKILQKYSSLEPVPKQQKPQQTVPENKTSESETLKTRLRRQRKRLSTIDVALTAVSAKRKSTKAGQKSVTDCDKKDDDYCDYKPSKSTVPAKAKRKIPLAQLTPEEKFAHKQALAEKHRLRQQLKRQQRTPEAKALEAEKARLRRQRQRAASNEEQTATVLEKQRRRMQAKRLTMTAEDKAIETVKTRLRRQRQRAEMNEKQLTELKAKRSSDYLKRREKLLSMPDVEIEKAKADKRWRAYMNRMAKRAVMDSQELERYEEEIRQRRKIHYLNQPPEVHKARAEKNKAWRLNLSGEKKKKFNESVKKAMIKYIQKVKQDPAKYQKYKHRISEYQRNRAANETQEQKHHRLFLFKLRQEKAKLRTQLEEEGLSNDEIQQRLEKRANEMKASQPTQTSNRVHKSPQHKTRHFIQPPAPTTLPVVVQTVFLPVVIEDGTFSETVVVDQLTFPFKTTQIKDTSQEDIVVNCSQDSSQCDKDYNGDSLIDNNPKTTNPPPHVVVNYETVNSELIGKDSLPPAPDNQNQTHSQSTASVSSVALEISNEGLNMCSHCGKTYKHKYSLDDHIRRDHERKYECDLCSKKCASRGKLWRHRREIHEILDTPPPTNCVKCEHCGKDILRSYDSHVRKHHPHVVKDETYISNFPFSLKYTGVGTGNNAIVECPECSKEIRKQGLIKHMRNVHGIGNKKSYPCAVCGREFKENYHLKEHMRQHDAIEEKMSQFKLLKYTLLQTNAMGTMCRLCGELLKKDKSSFHLEEKHVQVYAKLVKEETLILECEKCHEQKFADVDRLTKHMTLVHPDSCEICAECGQVTLTRQELDYHVKLEHQAKTVHKKRLSKWKERRTEFDCPVCKKVFGRQSECQAHAKTEHPNSFWQCDQCQSVFYAENAREVHQTFCRKKGKNGNEDRKESKVMLSCELCEQKLSLFSIGRHYRVKHGAEEDLWECEQCKKEFAQRAYWMKHMMFTHGTPLQEAIEHLEKVNCKCKSELKLKVSTKKVRKVPVNRASTSMKSSFKKKGKQIKKFELTTKKNKTKKSPNCKHDNSKKALVLNTKSDRFEPNESNAERRKEPRVRVPSCKLKVEVDDFYEDERSHELKDVLFEVKKEEVLSESEDESD